MELLQVIAERVFELGSGDGGEVILRVGIPREADADWVCPFEIRGNEILVSHAAFGVDSVQALFLALRMAAVDLRALAHERGEHLQWLGMDDLGLPV